MSNPISHLPMSSTFDQPQVSHHVHRDDEPLPGAKGAAPTFDYSADTIEHANIPSSELGTTPHTQSTHGQQQSHSPFDFTPQEKRDAPIVPTSTTQGQQQTDSPFDFTSQEKRDAPIIPTSTNQGQPPIAPYDRIVLENALNKTDEREEFDKNPLRTPSESREHDLHSQRDDSHIPTVPGTQASKHSFPPEVGTTENREFGGGLGHGVKGQGSGTVPGTSAPESVFPHPGTTENREFGSKLDESGVPTRSSHSHDVTSGTTKKKDSYDIDGNPTRKNKDTIATADTHDTTAKASLGDKIVGKAEKIAGSITGNPDLKEKGDLRAHPEKLN